MFIKISIYQTNNFQSILIKMNNYELQWVILKQLQFVILEMVVIYLLQFSF